MQRAIAESAAVRSGIAAATLLARMLAVLAVFAGVGLQETYAQEPPSAPAEAAPESADSSADTEVEALIRILEDDAARARLIERLRAEGASDGAIERLRAEETVAGRLAEYTREAAENAAEMLAAVSGLVDHVADIASGAFEIDFDAVRDVLEHVALLVAATFALFLLLQPGLRWLQRRMAESAASRDVLTRAKMMGGSVVLDGVTVLVAWAVGYVFALGIGPSGRIGLEQSLFLNAFLIIELIKTASRAVLSPRWTALRPAPVDDTSAAYWYFWLSRLVSLVGYTFLFVAPILATGVSSDVAEALRIAVMLAALVVLVAVVLQNRENVRARLMRRVAAGRMDPISKLLAIVARLWHIAAIAYLVVIFVLWIAHPDTGLRFVLSASWKSVVAILLGTLLATLIGRAASGGMRLSDDVKARLPLLEERLNAFVPSVLRVVRFVVTIAVAVTLLQVWNVADVAGWLTSETGQRVMASLISAALILLAGSVVYLVMQSWIEYRLNPNLGRYVGARERTLLGLFRNAFTVVLGTLVVMLVLSELGVNIGPLIAGAGVVGLAIGFGAQKLVQDVINGVFIQFENTLNEGDVVQLGGVSGVVERLTIRSVSLRSLDGTYHMIPFSSVDAVSNFVKHFSYHVAAIGVAYGESVADVKDAMLEAFARLKDTEHAAAILGEFEMQGVVELAPSSVVVRGRIKTLPGKHWPVGRAYNELVKQVFDERGIKFALPRMTIYRGEDKAESAAMPDIALPDARSPDKEQRARRDQSEPTEASARDAAASPPPGVSGDGATPLGDEADFALEDAETETKP